MASMLSLRLTAGLAAARHAAPQLQRSLASLPSMLAPWAHSRDLCTSSTCSPAASTGGDGWRQPQQQRRQQQRLAAARRRGPPPAASYSVVTGNGGSSSSRGSGSSGSGDSGSSGNSQPWKLIIYSKEGCHLCDGLKEKVEALLERAAFLPSALSTAELEVRDITSNLEWEGKYAMSIPVLAAAAADGSGEVEVPRPSPRFSADALQKHIEKFLAQQQLQ